MSTFPEFQKIPRLHRDVVITEKIDGTNGLIQITPYVLGDMDSGDAPDVLVDGSFITLSDHSVSGYDGALRIRAGSRHQWLSLRRDNHGFAQWVYRHRRDLAKLGEGLHYGEWWGRGIQRGYNQEVPRFSLFNTHRWGNEDDRPACCHVVPVLATGTGDQLNLLVESALMDLREFGSQASPGFRNPEGVVIYHTAANALFKVTLEGDRKATIMEKALVSGKAIVLSTAEPVNMVKPVGLAQFITDTAGATEVVSPFRKAAPGDTPGELVPQLARAA